MQSKSVPGTVQGSHLQMGALKAAERVAVGPGPDLLFQNGCGYGQIVSEGQCTAFTVLSASALSGGHNPPHTHTLT